MPYWQNYATNQIMYDEPPDELAHEKNLVGKRIKVYWVVQVRVRSGKINILCCLVRVELSMMFTGVFCCNCFCLL